LFFDFRFSENKQKEKMKIIKYPNKSDYKAILTRPTQDISVIEERVLPILQQVKSKGDSAIREYALAFDNVFLDSLEVAQSDIQNAESKLSDELKTAIKQAYANIFKFHEAQKSISEKIETMEGVTCWRKSVGIDKVGLYVPGGTAPLFSTVLMLGIPAKIAGCREVVLCTPSNHPAIYFAAQLCGISKIFRVGGSQAIAAMAYGTESIPQVYKIFGPGNQYVTAAKMLVNKEGVAIDMPAGPSEVAVYADDSANPVFVAADLLSQAEHGIDSQVLLVSTSEKMIEAVNQELSKQVLVLPRAEFASKALENSQAVLVESQEIALEMLNEYAAEHLIMSIENAEEVSEKIYNAGSIFLGNYTPESAGDYASGTNHTLPTNGYAKAYSGVSLDSFMKKITVQNITKAGIKNIGKTIIEMATAESLEAHANAVRVRL
jgi:histidinol dehydrogenase